MKEILSDTKIKGRLNVTGAVSAGKPEGPDDLVTIQYLDEATDGYVGELERHTQDFENPHQVTKAQVGLGDVENYSLADMPIPAKVQSALDAKADRSDLSTIYRPMGSVKYFADLPKEPYVHVGDVYDVRETGMNYVWVIRDGVGVWDELGLGIDINNYYTIDEVNEIEKNLSTRIDDEAADREKADTTLQDNIDAEAQTRADADTTLQANIDAEATARQTADSTLQKNIDNEAQARTSADGVLQANIDAEAQARADADTALDTAKVNRAGDTMTGILRVSSGKTSEIHVVSTTSLENRTDSLTTYGGVVYHFNDTSNAGGYLNFLSSNDESLMRLLVRQKNNTGTNLKEGRLEVHATPTDAYATCPSPSSKSDSSYKIATTAWVNQSDFLVHTYGAETIDGVKTFTGEIKHNMVFPKYVLQSTRLWSDVTDDPLSLGEIDVRIGSSGINYSYLSWNTAKTFSGMYVHVRHVNTDGTKTNAGGLTILAYADGKIISSVPSTQSDAVSNEIATANWCIGKFVDLSSNQTIDGTKTFTAPPKISTAGEFNWTNQHNILGSKGALGQSINMLDSTGRTSASIGHFIHSKEFYSSLTLNAYNKKSDGTEVRSFLGVAAFTDGTIQTTAATPVNKNDNSTRIATTAWVNQTDFLVHTTGNESISGTKEFTNYPVIKVSGKPLEIYHTGMDYTTSNSSECFIHFFDKNGVQTARIGTINGASKSVSINQKWNNVWYDLGIKFDGTKGFGYAPTTPADATSNVIATADWSIGKFVDKTGDTMTGALNVPDGTVGARTTEAVNANTVMADLDAYEHMMRTSGNQNITGVKYNRTTGLGGSVYIGGNTERWVRVAYTTVADAALILEFLPDKYIPYTLRCSGRLYIVGRVDGIVVRMYTTFSPETTLTSAVYVTFDGATYEVWYHYDDNSTNKRVTVTTVGSFYGRGWTMDGETVVDTFDPTTYTHAVNPVVII